MYWHVAIGFETVAVRYEIMKLRKPYFVPMARHQLRLYEFS
jgi:hypothetical protein